MEKLIAPSFPRTHARNNIKITFTDKMRRRLNISCVFYLFTVYWSGALNGRTLASDKLTP